jgi:ribonuclease E
VADATTEPQNVNQDSAAIGTEVPPEKPKRTRAKRVAAVTEAVETLFSNVGDAAEQPLAATVAPKRTRKRSVSASRATDVDTATAPAPEVTTAPLSDAADSNIAAALESVKPLRTRRSRKVNEAERDAALNNLALTIAADDANDSHDGEGEAEDEYATGRRRRRRGGRRRHRGGADGANGEAGFGDNDGETASNDASDAATDASENDDEIISEGNGRRRRRRRRRLGADANGTEEDSNEIVVRVREPRTKALDVTSDEVSGIEGSTRLEAKRQRRKEGRASGRKAPILTEAEFLARRESVERQMLIRQRDSYNQIAVLEDGMLVEHYVDRASSSSLIGNIYLGRVQNVLPSMEAVFVDIGRSRNAVLYAGEVDWESFGEQGSDRLMENVFQPGQAVLVQVSKDPIGTKGARLTGHISLPGRYVVYAPAGHLSGVSRKLPERERARLKRILSEVVTGGASVVIRTAAEGAAQEELVHDVERLHAQWDVIARKAQTGQAPQLLYSEPDLTLRIVRDLFTEDFAQLVVAGNAQAEDAYDSVSEYVNYIAPHLKSRLIRWDSASQGDLFARHRIDEQIAKALERKVFLPSGGSLIIDRTEAMTVIDVNTGRFTGSGGNLEETITRNNLEAAEEIVRQLRLRDLGGIVVIDFIDMVLPGNRELLLRRLVECLGRDRTRHQVSEITSLGLVQLTRKRIGIGLAEAFTVPCEHCGGRGYVRHDEPVATQVAADGGERTRYGGRRK